MNAFWILLMICGIFLLVVWLVNDDRLHRRIRRAMYRFKKEKWFKLVNRIQMHGLTKKQKVDIIYSRQHYHLKTKSIAKQLKIPKRKVQAVLYYYNCWKIKDWEELFLMNVTRKNYHISTIPMPMGQLR